MDSSSIGAALRLYLLVLLLIALVIGLVLGVMATVIVPWAWHLVAAHVVFH